MLNYQTVDFLASQLEDQYNKQVAAGLDPLPVEEQVPGFFRAQAAKLAANNVRSIYDVQQADGGIVNAATGEPIKDVVLRSSWETDPEAYRFRDPVALEERGGGKYTRWGKDLSITGQGDYGLTFVDNKPVFTPYWKDTKNFDVGDAMKTAAAIAAVYYGGQYLLSPETAAAAGAEAGAAGAGAGTGAGSSISLLEGAQFPVEGLKAVASTAPGATAPFATSTAATGFQASAIPTAAGMGLGQGLTVPVSGGTITGSGLIPTGAPIPLGGGPERGLLDNLRTANTVSNMLTQPTVQQQAGLLGGGGGGQPRGVDFSPLYQNTMVGLLPLAERFRRSLI
jgi:hypothetical protein